MFWVLNRTVSFIEMVLLSTHNRTLDKPAYRVKYENIWQEMHLFKFLYISCKKNKISITHLMFFQSVMSEMLYFISCLHVRKKVEEIRICFSSGMFLLLWMHRKSK